LRIKICGITSLADAEAAVEAGADALGFMFYAPSPRYVSFATAAGIISRLPPFITSVGVFVDAPAAFVQEAIAQTGINTLQFHGQETPAFAAQFHRKTIRAFRLRDRSSLDELTSHQASAWLLDSYVPGVLGGSGQTFNWDLAIAAKRLGGCVIQAGGLTPANVQDAVRQVQPYGLDVSSGVESVPGRKDAAKMTRFITLAAEALRGTPTHPAGSEPASDGA
jgi:phosphoribosylanthranilate isomerase